MATQDRLYLDSNDRNLIEKIVKENYFNFKEKTRKEQFLFAMVIGFNSGLDGQTIEKRDEWFFTKYLDNTDMAMLNACAYYKTNRIDIIKDIDSVYKIAEEYAHLGVKILYDRINSEPFGALEKKFEIEFNEFFNNGDF